MTSSALETLNPKPLYLHCHHDFFSLETLNPYTHIAIMIPSSLNPEALEVNLGALTSKNRQLSPQAPNHGSHQQG